MKATNNFSFLQSIQRSQKPQTEQSIYGYLKDTYYNFKFKQRGGVTTPKQLAMSLFANNKQ